MSTINTWLRACGLCLAHHVPPCIALLLRVRLLQARCWWHALQLRLLHFFIGARLRQERISMRLAHSLPRCARWMRKRLHMPASWLTSASRRWLKRATCYKRAGGLLDLKAGLDWAT